MSEPACSQCGTCCRKGGPLLHTDDISLVINDHISLENLITLRAGEWVHDPTSNSLMPLQTEVIKIAGTQEQDFPWHCILHTKEGCSLHPLRPVQCKALYCQDTTGIRDIYQSNRMTRQLILSHVPKVHGWAELAEAHEEQCSIIYLTHCLKNEQYNDIQHMLRYDEHFRSLCVEKAHIAQSLLPFLLGRPLSALLSALRRVQR